MKYWEPYLCVPHKLNGFDLRGWSCWGAVRYILAHHANLIFPEWNTLSAAEMARLSKRNIWKVVQEPQTFDVVCMTNPTKKGMFITHVGVLVEPNKVLHSSEEYGTVCIPLNHISIANRIAKLVRHESLDTCHI